MKHDLDGFGTVQKRMDLNYDIYATMDTVNRWCGIDLAAGTSLQDTVGHQ